MKSKGRRKDIPLEKPEILNALNQEVVSLDTSSREA